MYASIKERGKLQSVRGVSDMLEHKRLGLAIHSSMNRFKCTKYKIERKLGSKKKKDFKIRGQAQPI